jgi:hypothetical protein
LWSYDGTLDRIHHALYVEGTSNNGRFCRVMGHKIGAVFNLIFDRRFHGSFCAGCFG